MELAKWISFMVLWISASGQDEYPNPDTQNYQFNYFIRDESTGDIKSHEEKKLGDTVTGEYRVGEPTGDLRVVTYTADEGGFRANVKYEEGGSPLSDIRDKERQVSPVSGYQFEWLPGNPDDLQAAGKADSSEESSDKSQTTAEGSSEPTSEATSTEGAPVSEVTTEAEDSSSSEEEAAQKDEPPQPESPSESESKSNEADSKPDESESKSEEESKSDSETKEESPEAAASAPESQEAAPTEPNRVYLPPNLPFYTPPTPDSQDSPTIIYASQNFYNPWQWFGTTARIQREQPPEPPAGHYMTGLGYIIVPPNPDK